MPTWTETPTWARAEMAVSVRIVTIAGKIVFFIFCFYRDWMGVGVRGNGFAVETDKLKDKAAGH
jgi:hypothetical protein